MGRLAALMLVTWLATVPAARAAGGFAVTSPDLRDGGTVARIFVYGGCGGANQSPRLDWSSPPPGTRGFAVTVFDPDARQGAGWWHWLLTGLPADTRHLPRGVSSLPASARQWRNDFGDHHYDGPCPPPGDPPHHYRFTVYALDIAHLPLSGDASPARVKAALQRHALATTTLTARYGR